jgi:hypothetical protein
MPSDAGALLVTGIALGVLHVLTGPDHLSAIATLSVNVSCCTAFGLGVRWGIGHSTGLLVVGIILISLSDASKDTLEVPKQLTTVFESFVGIFMILLGSYGFTRAIRRQSEGSTREEDTLLALDSRPTERTSLSSGDVEDDAELNLRRIADEEPKQGLSDGEPIPRIPRLEIDFGHDHFHRKIKYCTFLVSKLSTNTMALMVGIVHGFAGPGGVLGVIPAVQIRDAKLSTLYLGTFCVASTLTMGCFASLYGVVSSWVGMKNGWEFRIECASAFMSVMVGITWLILLANGMLDVVFP